MYRTRLVKLSATARFSTVCIHAGQEPDPSTGAIITPIYQTSTYVQEALGRHKGYEYARTQNPTRSAVEANLAAIEGGKAGFAFASGMAAIGAIASLLQTGDHVVMSDNVYGGTFRLFDRVLTRYGITCTYVDTADLAHRRGARLVVDNTFASPVLQQPIALGADLVTHSTTKYLNGHSDSVGGVVIATRDDHIEWLRFVQNAEGAIIGPMDAWLVLRGTKTLAVRMAQHNANGLGPPPLPPPP